MTKTPTYKNAFYRALTLHLALIVALLVEPFLQPSSLQVKTENTEIALEKKPAIETVKAESIDAKALDETVQRLKEQRAQEKQQEINRQRAITQAAEAAKIARIKEQKRLEKLKTEADKIAIERKKQAAQEERRLKQLAEQKKRESEALKALKREQEKIKQAQAEEKRRQEIALRLAKEKADRERAEKEQAERDRQQAIQAAQLAGEVNKYKALIVSAISREWILPDHVDQSLSSKFRIRLAPDGTVLEVSLLRSSGDSVLDRSAKNAIFKASPLPVPSDPQAFNVFRDISLTVRPEQLKG